MKRCIQCNGANLRHAEETVDVRVPTASGELEVSVSGVSATRCDTCGESYLAGLDLERAELLASAEAMRRGLKEGSTLEFVRKALGLRVGDLGQLLDIPAATVSEWEDGSRSAERGLWNTLADLVSDELAGTTTTLDRLLAVAEPRIPGEPVRIALGAAGAK